VVGIPSLSSFRTSRRASKLGDVVLDELLILDRSMAQAAASELTL
jgi:hypothetical protein